MVVLEFFVVFRCGREADDQANAEQDTKNWEEDRGCSGIFCGRLVCKRDGCDECGGAGRTHRAIARPGKRQGRRCSILEQ